MEKINAIPSFFTCVQDHGLECDNYYFKQGSKIGLTREDLTECGLPDERMWIHRGIINRIVKASKELHDEYGFNLVIKDAWRPIALYKAIIKKRRGLGLEVDGLFNEESMPHATGLAFDITLKDDGGETVFLYDDKRLGPKSRFMEFYLGNQDAHAIELRSINLIIQSAFEKKFIVLGECSARFGTFNVQPLKELLDCEFVSLNSTQSYRT